MANHGRKLPREKIDYIIAEYKRGRNMPNIAAEMGVSDATIRNYLVEADVPRRRAGCQKEVTDELTNVAAEMRAEGIPWKTISKKIGLSACTLDRELRKRNREEALMPSKKFSKKQTAYIVEQYQKGRSSHNIAREMGVTMQTILVYLEEQNVIRRVAGAKKIMTPEMAQAAKDMRAQGNKWAYIAAKLGVSRETVRVWGLKTKESSDETAIPK